MHQVGVLGEVVDHAGGSLVVHDTENGPVVPVQLGLDVAYRQRLPGIVLELHDPHPQRPADGGHHAAERAVGRDHEGPADVVRAGQRGLDGAPAARRQHHDFARGAVDPPEQFAGLVHHLGELGALVVHRRCRQRLDDPVVDQGRAWLHLQCHCGHGKFLCVRG